MNCKSWYLGNVCPFQLLYCVRSQLSFCCSNVPFCFLISPGPHSGSRLSFLVLILMHVSVLKEKFELGVASANVVQFVFSVG
jgi:hypothetical protein